MLQTSQLQVLREKTKLTRSNIDFVIKLSGILVQRQLCLVRFLVIQSSLDCVEDLWLERNWLCHSPRVCSWNKRLQQFRQLQWKCLQPIQASLPLTLQDCIERFGSPVHRMFFERISQCSESSGLILPQGSLLRILSLSSSSSISLFLSLLCFCMTLFLRTEN